MYTHKFVNVHGPIAFGSYSHCVETMEKFLKVLQEKGLTVTRWVHDTDIALVQTEHTASLYQVRKI
jgi:hypothetical protein